MKQFIRFTAVAVLFLFIGLSTSTAQTFSAGPAVIPTSGADNGGFFWGDVNGDGYLDVWVPSNNIVLSTNSGKIFSAVSTATTSQIILQAAMGGGVLVDLNGDGTLDLMSTNSGRPQSGLYYNTAGVFAPATGTSALPGAPGFGTTNNQTFMGLAVAPIDHTGYLSIVWPVCKVAYNDGTVFGPGYGMVLLKGGASGFTNAGVNATAANLAIDTSKTFESWDPRFFDANNDGYQDLLMPSFRHGLQATYGGPDSAGARKGCVLFLNDGTGKFIIPTSASVGRTLYDVDSISSGQCWGHAVGDTGIVVDDTVQHFGAIGCHVGDLNNDGNMDMILTSTGADNWNGMGAKVNTVVLYGKGDGTFTYHWSGTTTVTNGLTNQGGTRAWGFGDYNNDGWLDLYTGTNGGSTFLYKNNGDGTFTDVSAASGVTFAGRRAGDFVDYDKDGYLDIYEYTGGNSLLEKNSGGTNSWVGCVPVGPAHNKQAIGARFTVYSGSTTQIREISATGGSAGQGGALWANFGLGAGTLDSMKVQWPDGASQKWTRTQLAAGGAVTPEKKYWSIVEGADVPLAPATSRPSWLAKNDTALLSKDTLRWNKVTGGTAAVTYEAQVATIRTFSTVLKDVTNLTDSSTIVNLGLSSTYYWRVRAMTSGFTGAWSAVDSFKTLYTPCTTTPTPLYPLAGSVKEPNKPTLKVNYVFTASTYHIEVDTLNRYAIRDTAGASATTKYGSLVLNDSTAIFDTTYTFATALKPTYKYFWRVRGWNSAGSSGWSAVDSFTVIFVPATPVKSYPSANQANVAVNPLTLKWRHESGDSNFVVQLWTYTSGGQVLNIDTTKHDTSWTITTGLYSRFTYYWKVQCFNQGGASAYSAVDSFTTVIEVPVQPTLDAPRNLTGVNRKTKFTWLPVINATSYHLQVATTSAFAVSDIKVDVKVQDTTVTISDTLLASTVYYWRVSGVNLGGEGAFSSVAHYTTGGQTSVDGSESPIPKDFALMQNYPNPFNPTTTISYDIPKSSYVTLKIYDVLGRLVSTLVDGIQPASSYRLQWNPAGLSSGVYFYRIQARSQDGSKNFTSVKKLMFMK